MNHALWFFALLAWSYGLGFWSALLFRRRESAREFNARFAKLDAEFAALADKFKKKPLESCLSQEQRAGSDSVG